MNDKVRFYYDMTPEEVYAGFLNTLAGLEDDAAIEGYSRAGVDQLRNALVTFQAEYRTRHESGKG